MGRKIAMVTLIHECDEDPCHLNNDIQESWIRKNLDSNGKLKWNWHLHKVRVVDIQGDESPSPLFEID